MLSAPISTVFHPYLWIILLCITMAARGSEIILQNVIKRAMHEKN